jgi:WXG100 family type VII secretion target
MPMPKLLVAPDEIQSTAEAFESASRNSKTTLAELEKSVLALEAKWDGASRQAFYRNYLEWKTAMGGLAVLLHEIGRELSRMGDDLAKADRKPMD